MTSRYVPTVNTETASDVIEAKGVAAFADALVMPRETVRQWKHRNILPRSKWPEIMDAFPDLTLARLRRMEARVKSPALRDRLAAS